MHGGVISGRWPQYLDLVLIHHGFEPRKIWNVATVDRGWDKNKSVVHRG